MGGGQGRGPIEEEMPDLPPERLPASVLVGEGSEAKGVKFRALETFNGEHPFSINCADEICRDRVDELRQSVSSIIGDEGLTAREKAEKLIGLGRMANGMAEQFFIIHTAFRGYSEFDIVRGGDIGLFELFADGSHGTDCKGYSKAYKEYFEALGISPNRLRDSFIAHNHRALFIQLDDGRWVVLERSAISPPIETTNYWEALAMYSGNSQCRGYIDPHRGTMVSKKSVKAACGEQWQQLWGLSEFLIMHPDEDERVFGLDPVISY